MTKIIFRPQRASLNAAMAEAVEFDSVEDLKDYIVESYFHNHPEFSVDDIIISDESISDYVGNVWRDTRSVCVKRWFGTALDYPQCIGMCTQDFPEPIIFRPERLSLDASMVEAKEFRNVDEMKENIVKSLNKYHDWFTTDDIVISFDSTECNEEICWFDQMRVCIKRWGEKIFSTPLCVGMCATEYYAPA